MTQDAQLRIGPSPADDYRQPAALRDELSELTLRVAQHVSAAATLVWFWFWHHTGYGPGTTRVTLASMAAVTGKTKKQAHRHVAELAACGLVTVLDTYDGCRGGIELRIEDAPAILTPGPTVARGDPQQPLFDAAAVESNVSQNASLPSRSVAPIIDHGARSNPSPIIGHRSLKEGEESDLTNDHDALDRHVRSGPSRSAAGSNEVEPRRLAADIKRRRRELKAHLADRPDDADALRNALGQPLSEHDAAKAAEQRTARHMLLCEMIVTAIRDPQLPVGLVHDVAELVLADALPERVLTRILGAIRRRRPKNPGGYFRRCVETECHKRGVDPPRAPRGP